MLLTGHEGEVFCSEFSPDGRSLATGPSTRASSCGRSTASARTSGSCAAMPTPSLKYTGSSTAPSFTHARPTRVCACGTLRTVSG